MISPVARLLGVGGACLAVAALTVTGTLLPVREPRPVPPIDPDGRTVTVCPAAPVINLVSSTTWGALTTRPVNAENAEPVPAGRGLTLSDQAHPVLMIAEGRQNQGAAAASFARHAEGADRGLALARCSMPATSSWFTGLVSDPGAETARRAVVQLINADAGAAEVDLVLFGPSGLQVAPGARGIAVPGKGVRSVALDTLFVRGEPVGLQVRATRGRVTAVVEQHIAAGAPASGTDWQVPSHPPAQELVVPGIPPGPGTRSLVLTNPGKLRTTATIEVLGQDGTFAPVDASSVDVNAESTAAVSLHPGLDGEPGAVRVRADQPLVAAVVSHSAEGPQADIAIQPAASTLSATSIGAVAAVEDVRGTLLVTNAGSEVVRVPAVVVDTDGDESLRTDLEVTPGTTATWVIDDVDRPVAVRVSSPADAQVHAGLVLTSEVDPTAGLATTPLSSPQQERGSGIEPVFEATVGQ